MIKSMTGFGGRTAKIMPFGEACVELRSSNHKFLDIVFHLPPGFLSLEERLKKEIAAKIKRGRVTCALNISSGQGSQVFINKGLLKNYISALRNIKEQFSLQDNIRLEALIHLPGVLSLAEDKISRALIWPRLNILVNQALEDLARTRQKEGRALYAYLKGRAKLLEANLEAIKVKFKKAVQNKLSQINTDEERSSFLKCSDITEELERLSFHIKNFKNKLAKSTSVGKELDFIAQEMQREANTIGAKSCAVAISAMAVQIKSQVEKLREQLQNIE